MDMVSSAHFSLSAHAVLSVLVTQTCSSQSLSASDTSVGRTWNLASSFQGHCSPSLASAVSLSVVGARKQGFILDSFLSFPNLQSITRYLLSPLPPKYICIGAFLTISISRNAVWAGAVASIWSLLSYLFPCNSFGTQQSNFCEVKI